MHHKNEADLSYMQFLACALYNRFVGCVFMACLYVFPACLAEMLLTLQWKTGRLPVVTGSVQVRSVMFMTGLFAFKCGQFVLMACLKVESWYLIRTVREVVFKTRR